MHLHRRGNGRAGALRAGVLGGHNLCPISSPNVHFPLDASDQELLLSYIDKGDQEAFTALVRRHVHLVHAAAKRQCPEEAEDVTQAVFLLLAQKAPALRGHVSLAVWLHRATGLCCANARKLAGRRRRHEREAAMQHDIERSRQESSDATAHERLLPLLDEALRRLPARYREAVLLRYLEGHSVEETSHLLGVSIDAAGKRATRGLKLLRSYFAQRGHAAPAAALAAALAGQSAARASEAVAAAAIAAGTGAAATHVTAIAAAASEGLVLLSAKGLVAAVVASLLVASALTTAIVLQTGQSVPVAPADPGAWRERFDAVYALEGGEVLKRVAPPFIPERMRHYHETAGDLAMQVSEPTSMRFIYEPDVGVRWERAWHSNRHTVRSALRRVMNLHTWEASGPEELMAMPLPGDWVVRAGTSEAEIASQMQWILGDAAGRPLVMERREVEREVVVVSGQVSLVPVRPELRGVEVSLHVGETKPARLHSHHAGQLDQVMRQAGEELGAPVVVEVEGAEKVAAWMRIDQSARLAADPEGPEKRQRQDEALRALAAQTGLSFIRAVRTIPVWFIMPGGGVATADEEARLPGRIAVAHFHVLLDARAVQSLIAATVPAEAESEFFTVRRGASADVFPAIRQAYAAGQVPVSDRQMSHTMLPERLPLDGAHHIFVPQFWNSFERGLLRFGVALTWSNRPGATIRNAPGGIELRLQDPAMWTSVQESSTGVLQRRIDNVAIDFSGVLMPGEVVVLLGDYGPMAGEHFIIASVWQAYKTTDAQHQRISGVSDAAVWVRLGPSELRGLADRADRWAGGRELPPEQVSEQWTRRLPNGTTVRLVAVGQPRRWPFCWWDADGEPVASDWTSPGVGLDTPKAVVFSVIWPEDEPQEEIIWLEQGKARALPVDDRSLELWIGAGPWHEQPIEPGDEIGLSDGFVHFERVIRVGESTLGLLRGDLGPEVEVRLDAVTKEGDRFTHRGGRRAIQLVTSHTERWQGENESLDVRSDDIDHFILRWRARQPAVFEGLAETPVIEPPPVERLVE